MARPGRARAHPGLMTGAKGEIRLANRLPAADDGKECTAAATAAAAAAAPAARLRAPLTVGSRSIDSRRLSRRAGAARHSMTQRSSPRLSTAWLSPSSPGSLCDWRSPARPGTMAGAWQARRHASGPAPLRSARLARPVYPQPIRSNPRPTGGYKSRIECSRNSMKLSETIEKL